MRILHTSDWHLGARLCDRDRIDEHRDFLNWLKKTINSESIDILLISGDIFDSTNPPNSAEMLYFDFLCSLKDSHCSAAVITGGNHDSISKLNSPKELLSFLSIYVNGGIVDSPEKNNFAIKNNKNENIAIISAIPFLRERDVHIQSACESWQEREYSVLEGIKKVYNDSYIAAETIRGNKEIPIIAMGHLFAAGSASGAGQRDLYAGNLGAVPSGIFPEEFAYTALGHIHRAQKVASREDIRYCGSPIHMDFGEKGDKEVLLVDFEEDRFLSCESLKVPVFRQLIRFNGTFEEICRKIELFSKPAVPFWADAEVSGGIAAGDISSILNEKASLKGFEFLRIRITGFQNGNIMDRGHTVDIKDLDVNEVFINRCQKAGISDDEMKELLPLHEELLLTVLAGDNED